MSKAVFVVLIIALISIMTVWYVFFRAPKPVEIPTEGLSKDVEYHLKLDFTSNFFTENKCSYSKTVNETVVYECENFDMEVFPDRIARYKFDFRRTVTDDDVKYIFYNNYFGKEYKELFGCEDWGNSFGNTVEIGVLNCSYGIARIVRFQKTDNSIKEIFRSLSIDMNRTTEEDLINITRQVYGKMIESHKRLKVPSSFSSENCAVNVTEDQTLIRISLCDDVYVLSANKITNVLHISNELERFAI